MKKRSAFKMILLSGIFLLGGVSCTVEQNEKEQVKSSMTKEKKMKKYTNEDFYVDGKLSPEKTKAAYMEMFEYYGYSVEDFLDKNLFITDFGLGDFVNVGMAGVFWINDDKHGYFAHEIYLLPNQMIVEHKHLETEHPAKMESWHVRYGSISSFGEGDETAGNPKTPKSQKDFITVNHVTNVAPGEVATLNRVEAPHFMIAGDKGAIVSEYANFHDGNGLDFTNPDVVFADILASED